VRNGEEGSGLCGQNGLFLADVCDANGEDRAGRGARIAEPFDVGLAERPLPGEGLAGNGPGAIAVALAFGDLRQVQGHPGCLIDTDHVRTVSTARGPTVRP